MIRINLGREVAPGVWLYTIDQATLESRSRQPLLDACRAIKRMGGDTGSQQIGLYREGRDKPDLFCRVDVGAGLTVDETGPYFHKWKPRDPSSWTGR